MQMLWDRGEANGYAHHMTTDPLPNTPPHEVLLHVAFGDHQVANVTAEVEARTIGAVDRTPTRSTRAAIAGRRPALGHPAVDFLPRTRARRSSTGTPARRTAPTHEPPPREGRDPHGHPRNDVKARTAEGGVPEARAASVTEQCGGAPATRTATPARPNPPVTFSSPSARVVREHVREGGARPRAHGPLRQGHRGDGLGRDGRRLRGRGARPRRTHVRDRRPPLRARLHRPGSSPASIYEYEVELDGERVWPEPDSEFPPSVISTLEPGGKIDLVFASCRVALPHEEPYTLRKDEDERGREVDSLYVLASADARGRPLATSPRRS